MKKVELFEDRILVNCDEAGVTPAKPVKGKEPGSRGKLTVKDIFGEDSEEEDDVEDLDEEEEEEDDDEDDDEGDDSTPTKKRPRDDDVLQSFSIDFNIRKNK